MGIGSPQLVADLTTYEYSLDGVTWETMTAGWEIREDLGDQIYNKEMFIRLQATSDTIETTIKSYRLYFSKQVLNLSGISDTPLFPEDYSGISGTDLLKRAPKT